MDDNQRTYLRVNNTPTDWEVIPDDAGNDEWISVGRMTKDGYSGFTGPRSAILSLFAKGENLGIPGNIILEDVCKPEVEVKRIAQPPRLVWSWFARMLMSPSGYRLYWEPHIADMHDEYFECIARGDEWGGRRAIIRAHVYAIPGVVWGIGVHVLTRVVEWLKA